MELTHQWLSPILIAIIGWFIKCALNQITETLSHKADRSELEALASALNVNTENDVKRDEKLSQVIQELTRAVEKISMLNEDRGMRIPLCTKHTTDLVALSTNVSNMRDELAQIWVELRELQRHE